MALLKRRIRVWELPVNWLIVFFGNLAGALTFVAFLGESYCLRCHSSRIRLADSQAHWSGLYNTPALISFSQTTSVSKTSQNWGQCLLRGVGCNFLGKPCFVRVAPFSA